MLKVIIWLRFFGFGNIKIDENETGGICIDSSWFRTELYSSKKALFRIQLKTTATARGLALNLTVASHTASIYF